MKAAIFLFVVTVALVQFTQPIAAFMRINTARLPPSGGSNRLNVTGSGRSGRANRARNGRYLADALGTN
ncbi:unnamed protein product [Dicrocoelium dendriticum]|nr:unnamed protein product [Dicrocoelium dendriticum]